MGSPLAKEESRSMNAPVRTFEATAAVRVSVPLLIGLTAPSGGGKTFSALRLATGIQSVVGGDIYVIDTENHRALHYADQFKFIHIPFTPPFGSLDYLAAIRFCAAKKPAVVVVDSMTHEHVGEGGYLETCEAVVQRIAGDDYKKRERAHFAGLAKAGPLRTKMIEGIKQCDGNFIFCWRAKEKVKPVRGGEPVELGLMPIGGSEWVYEMAMNCMLPARSDGVPQWQTNHVGERMMMKLPEQFKRLFSDGRPLDENHGRALAEWASGGKPSQIPRNMVSPPEDRAANSAAPHNTTGNREATDGAADFSQLETMAREAAMRGRDVFTVLYKNAARGEQAHLRGMKAELEQLFPA